MKQHQLSRMILGVCLVLGGCAQDRLVKLDRTPNLFLKYWEKNSVAPEERSRESIDCGGNYFDGPNFGNRERAAVNRREGETDNMVDRRLSYAWQRCMLSKGYRFTGQCFDNEISKNNPACSTP